jgi:ATP-dependent Lon protease
MSDSNAHAHRPVLAIDTSSVPSVLPLLPVRDIVLFPGAETWIHVGRPSSKRLLNDTLPHQRVIGVFTQKYNGDHPEPHELCRVGVAAQIGQIRHEEDASIEISVIPYTRIGIGRILSLKPFIRAEVTTSAVVPPLHIDRLWEATVEELRKTAEELIRLSAPANSAAKLERLEMITDGGTLADLVASDLELEVSVKQDLLEELDEARRVRAVLLQATDQLEIARLRRKIRRDVEASFTASRRQAYLQEQIRIMREELGEGRSEGEQQASELRLRLEKTGLPKNVMERAERELQRLAALRSLSAEHATVLEYLEFLATLPWGRPATAAVDLARLRIALDREHYDLLSVKQRIFEHVAARLRNPAGHYPIPCLLGPPGVGKTSLARSLAAALGRKFSKLALGGVQTEGELVGVRRTRPDAIPGLPVRELRRLGVANPLLLLAGVDQLPNTAQGDSAHGLLELIDPRQNKAFVDRFLDVAFDMSQVFFLATAHYADDIPNALRDCLEMVRLPGYSDIDKRIIARRFLVPRQRVEHGLTAEQCRFEDKALGQIVSDYTREAGVRVFDRRIGELCRAAVARLKPHGRRSGVVVTPAFVEEVLGPPRHLREARLVTANTGVVTGLAWTNVGGEIMHIEALRFPGKGHIMLTGQIGSVMKESAQAALSLLKSRAEGLSIPLADLLDSDIHVHVPAGAVPKDGPSAGAAIFTAIVSLWSGQTARADVAMTGEITLRGLILPIGGLKEKILAAQRAGIPTVILPKLNEKDLADVPASVRAAMKLVLVQTVDEVLAAALNPLPGKPKPVPRRRDKARAK